jgi:hypothetical protein
MQIANRYLLLFLNQGRDPFWNESKGAIAFWLFLAVWKGRSVLWMERGDRSFVIERSIALFDFES